MADAGADGQEADKKPPPTEEPSDHWLLRQFQGGSQGAATGLYVRYASRLRALVKVKSSADLARCIEADDIVQSVFRTFFRRAGSGLYDVPPGGELWNLFLVIALNKIRTAGEFYHAAKRDVRLTAQGQVFENSAAEQSSQDDTSYHFLQLVVRELLEPLSPSQQRMIQLRIEGFEVAEIARQVGRSKRTVERVMQDFRKRLNRALAEDPLA